MVASNVARAPPASPPSPFHLENLGLTLPQTTPFHLRSPRLLGQVEKGKELACPGGLP